MGNIFSDFIDDVKLKPTKLKIMLKWVIRIAITLILAAFTYGQIKMTRLNKLNDMERILNEQTKTFVEFKKEIKIEFDKVNGRIDKVYNDGSKSFNDYQIFTKEQFGLVIDYAQTNKEMLKRIIDINVGENTKNVESQLEVARDESFTYTIKPIVQQIQKNQNFISLIKIIDKKTNDTIFQLIGATKDYISKIDKNKYNIGKIVQSESSFKLFNVTYTNK